MFNRMPTMDKCWCLRIVRQLSWLAAMGPFTRGELRGANLYDRYIGNLNTIMVNGNTFSRIYKPTHFTSTSTSAVVFHEQNITNSPHIFSFYIVFNVRRIV